MTNTFNAKQKIAKGTQTEKPGFPVRIKIPKINVDTNIENVGVTATGDMEVPTDTLDAGWFALGPRPGERGSAVISGHVSGVDGKAGVFVDLYKLKEGDRFYVEDDRGVMITFIVRKSRLYDPGYAEDVFSQSDSAHVNLITCDGVWDEAKKSYTKRLVIFADNSGSSR
ncbi:MAG: class F sortase [Candidatus Levybacteria bacterium]|nr:class F sortase [Candidatus Levybacteria bacterium]